MKKKSRRSISKFFEDITEIVGWLQIVIASALLSFFVGFVIYVCFRDTAGLVLGIAIVLLGMFLGVSFATRKFKTTGTIDLLSKVSSTPELDPVNEKKNPAEENKSNNT